MTIYTIENGKSNITAHQTLKQAKSVSGAQPFASEAALGRLAADWPASRLVAIWNTLPGVTPVKKFKDRAAAVRRIWAALEAERVPPPQLPTCEEAMAGITGANTAAVLAPQTADVAARTPHSAEEPRAKEVAHEAPPQKNKTEVILALLRQPGGTTLNAIMEATEWQAHSVRGFISGTLRGKMNLVVTSSKGADRQRTYAIE